MYKFMAEREGVTVKCYGRFESLSGISSELYDIDLVDDEWPEGCDAVACNEVTGKKLVYEADAWWNFE